MSEFSFSFLITQVFIVLHCALQDCRLLTSFFDLTSLITLSRQQFLHLNIHICHFPNYSENFIIQLQAVQKLFTFLFRAIYRYNRIFRNVIHLWCHRPPPRGFRLDFVLFACRPQLWKFICFWHLNLFTCGFFAEFVWLRRFFSIHSLDDLKKMRLAL